MLLSQVTTVLLKVHTDSQNTLGGKINVSIKTNIATAELKSMLLRRMVKEHEMPIVQQDEQHQHHNYLVSALEDNLNGPSTREICLFVPLTHYLWELRIRIKILKLRKA